MIVKLALAALISGIAIPALAISWLSCVESRSALALPGADAAVSAVESVGHPSFGRPSLGPFLSGLI